jgi:hypothetical protein
VLTLFSVPKPFHGHIGEIQRNAIASWKALDPDVQVVLVGDDEGVEEAAHDAGVLHVGALERSPRGTPRLDSAFARVDEVARHSLRCFVNADIVLLADFLPAVRRVARRFDDFLLVGESRDLALPAGAPLGDEWFRRELRRRARAEGLLRGYAALDYFVFPRGHFGELPPFLIGRACFDNWLVWHARQVGPVVDATHAIVSVHQSHDYGHVAGGKEEAYYGEEAKRNEELAGGRSHIYTLYDASHRLPKHGPIYRYWGSVMRAREGMRAARVKLQIQRDVRRARRRNWEAARRAAPQARVVGVFARPTPEQSAVLDGLSGRDDVDLSVLYTAAGDGTAPSHTHWVMRSTTIRGHRVNYMILRALARLHPDVVLVGGGTGFAGRAAEAWCKLLRVPCLAVEAASLDADAVVRAAGRAA